MVLRNMGRYPDNKTFLNDYFHKGGDYLQIGGKYAEQIGNLGEKGTPFVAMIAPEFLPEYELAVKGLKYGGKYAQVGGKMASSVQLD